MQNLSYQQILSKIQDMSLVFEIPDKKIKVFKDSNVESPFNIFLVKYHDAESKNIFFIKEGLFCSQEDVFNKKYFSATRINNSIMFCNHCDSGFACISFTNPLDTSKKTKFYALNGKAQSIANMHKQWIKQKIIKIK